MNLLEEQLLIDYKETSNIINDVCNIINKSKDYAYKAINISFNWYYIMFRYRWDIAKYSVLNDNKRLFQSKYKLYLPTEEEFKREIEREKESFYLNKNKF